ncbi:MAG: type II CRISPR-associated endonuclease Cas1 [Muribaculaceae bacterium]|nr:type II CRISPR-associated endonuclease Cas1 [Muribaculaceae bacterium]
MLKRTIAITSPCSLTQRNAQLIITSSDGTSKSVPIEDLSTVIIENQRATISIPAINALTESNVAVILCDNKMMPSSLIFPLEGHTLQGERYRVQLEASLPQKKNIWKQVIESKIRNQAALLNRQGKNGNLLKPYYSSVKSGDSDNREGIAAAAYWKELFGHEFVRTPKGEPPNNLLNYGYAILRAATSRAIVSAGMLPSLGIHHKNKYNPFPLADDLMEPFRPWVDELVFELWNDNQMELTVDVKQKLIQVVYEDAQVSDRRHPLSIALSMLCTSVVQVMKGEAIDLNTPSMLKSTLK